jgi:transposase
LKNKYQKRSHISEVKFRQVLKCFSVDIPALSASVLSGLNRKTTQRIYSLLRKRIVALALEEARPFVGDIVKKWSKSGQSRVLSLFERVRSRINTHSEGLICPVLRFVTFSRPHAESWAETLSTGRGLDLPVGFLGDGGGCAAGVGRHEGRPSKVGFGGRR